MTDAALASVDDLGDHFVNNMEPEILYWGHYQLFSETDETLKGHPKGRGSHPEEYDRVRALIAYWADAADPLGYEGGDSPIWTCEVKDAHRLVVGADLMKLHAPGVALARPVGSRPDQASGFTFARSGSGRSGMDKRDSPGSEALRLASAFVCMGELPPSILVLKALSGPLPWPVDDVILDAFKRSIAAMESRCSDALQNIENDASLKDVIDDHWANTPLFPKHKGP